jgi:hypothetical protein
VRFKIKGIRGGKALNNFLKLPPLLQNKLLYLRYFGGATAAALENRVSRHGKGPNYGPIPRFRNTGGMWSGFSSRISGQKAKLMFSGYSYPSSIVKNSQKRFKSKQDRDKWLNRMRKDKKTKKIDNRVKAISSQWSKGARNRNILEPSRDEVNCLLTWSEQHMESIMVEHLIDVSELNKRMVPDRFRMLSKRLPNPKNSR